MTNDKQRAREQWGNDPAGAVYGSKHEFGTREFFDEVERHRYQEYAPWMPEVMGFNDFPVPSYSKSGAAWEPTLLQFARGGAKVTGVDLTPRSIETSRHHLELYGQSWRICRLPIANVCHSTAESFDVAVLKRSAASHTGYG